MTSGPRARHFWWENFTCDTQQVSRACQLGRIYLEMEELADINFLAVIEGQDYEKSLKKIISTSFIHF